jgi:GT2 family glycosyltransferase
MKLSIVLLTWNSEKHVLNCLNSITNNVYARDTEIIVVDNGSVDDTISIISKQFPSVRLIKNSENIGIAPARNQGIKAAQGEYIMILDIDTSVHEGAINTLLKHMETYPEVGLCGPCLCFKDGTLQNSFRRFPLIQTKFLRRINTKWAKNLLMNEYYENDGSNNEKSVVEPIEVDYVIGACQIIRRRVIDEVGLLDDRIFYGPEDVDFCLRLWLKGWKVHYLPDAVVTHYEQRITRKRFFSYITIKHIQGLIHYFIKHRYLFSRKSLYSRINRQGL